MNAAHLKFDNDTRTILNRASEVIRFEAEALLKLEDSLNESFVAACHMILGAKGRVIVTGMGKSGHIGRKAAATFSSTGTPAIYVHPAEAAHGDLGMLVEGDVLIVISNSGSTAELHVILRHASLLGVPVIGIASRPGSLVMRHANVQLHLPSAREACHNNIAPTTSTTMQLALCDALAMAVMDLRGFSRTGMKMLHPGGAIGLRLLPVRDIMHGKSAMPLVAADACMPDVISEMTSRGFGIAGIIDTDGALLGVITDGDLRRHFEVLKIVTAREVMTTSPRCLSGDLSAETALELFNDLKISVAFVAEEDARGRKFPIGVIHMHDFLRVGLG